MEMNIPATRDPKSDSGPLTKAKEPPFSLKAPAWWGICSLPLTLIQKIKASSL